MKRYITILMAAAVALCGCAKEERPTPSLQETDWSKDLDMSNPTVKSFYEECGVGILTDFDPSRDMLFNLDSYWKYLSLEKFEDAEQTARAFEFLNESFLVYFTNKEFIRENFPRKILLAREVFLDYSNHNPYCPATEESDARVGDYARNSLHSIYGKGSFAFSVKLETIYFSQANYNNYMRDNLYLFIANLFERNNLYAEFGPDFYLPVMERYYGREFSGLAGTMNNNKPGVWVEEGGSAEDEYADKYWYWNKGFVSTTSLNPVVTYGAYMDMIRLRSGEVTSSYKFPNREREARAMINQLIFMSQQVWDSYPDIVKGRFRVLVDKFDQWGIDIRRINPTIESVFPR